MQLADRPSLISRVAGSLTAALRAIKTSQNTAPRVHFSSAVEGCSASHSLALSQSFERFLGSCSTVLAKGIALVEGKSLPPAEVEEWAEMVVAGLRACAIDYDLQVSFVTCHFVNWYLVSLISEL